MPIRYALTKPIKISTLARKVGGAFEADIYEPIKYSYEKLIDKINLERDLELFDSLEEAERCLQVESRNEPGTMNQLSSQAINSAPAQVGALLLTGFLHGPTVSRYQRMLLKIFVFDNNLANQSSISAIHFDRYWADNKFIHSRLSKDNTVFLDTITFQGGDWCQQRNYPASYTQIFNKERYLVKAINGLVKDYYAPTGGWFLTGHWNRHHNDLAKALHQKIQDDPVNIYTHLLETRKKLLEINCNLDGSFFKRVNCAIELMIKHEGITAPRLSLLSI